MSPVIQSAFTSLSLHPNCYQVITSSLRPSCWRYALTECSLRFHCMFLFHVNILLCFTCNQGMFPDIPENSGGTYTLDANTGPERERERRSGGTEKEHFSWYIFINDQ